MKPEMSSTEEILLKLSKDLKNGAHLHKKLPNSYVNKVLKKDLKLRKFRGVFPCDRMKTLREGESMILNTDPHYLEGKHFVALTRQNGQIIYFDSLAERLDVHFPELFKELSRKRMFPLMHVLNLPIQAPDSNFCGIFCIDYILCLYSPFSNVRTTKYELHPFNLKKNDEICLKNVIRKLKVRQ